MSVYALKTKHAPWTRYRSISSDDTLLTTTTKKGTDADGLGYVYRIPEAMNNIEVRISCSSTGTSATAYLYGIKYKNKAAGTWDDVCLVGIASLTSGAQVSSNGYYYVDTVVVTDRWFTGIRVADGDGNDGMSRIAFDVIGYHGFFIQMNPTNSETWIIDISGLG